jgi:hypothetical protein
MTDMTDSSVAPLPHRVGQEKREPQTSDSDSPMVKPEHRRNLINWLTDRYRLTYIPSNVTDRILVAHPDFVFHGYNLEQLTAILDRKSWKKNISDQGQFAYRWESTGAGSLYAQVKEVMLDQDPLEYEAAQREKEIAAAAEANAQGDAAYAKHKADIRDYIERFDWSEPCLMTDELAAQFKSIRNSDPEWLSEPIDSFVKDGLFTWKQVTVAFRSFLAEKSHWMGWGGEGKVALIDFENIAHEVKVADRLMVTRSSKDMDAAIELWLELGLDEQEKEPVEPQESQLEASGGIAATDD